MLVCTFVCANRTRDRGCSKHPVFPAPLCPENLSQCANGRLRTNRPLLELSPLRPKATEPVSERGTAPVSSSTRTVARASSPNRARKGVDDGTRQTCCRRYRRGQGQGGCMHSRVVAAAGISEHCPRAPQTGCLASQAPGDQGGNGSQWWRCACRGQGAARG